jgi:hypothetical protein
MNFKAFDPKYAKSKSRNPPMRGKVFHADHFHV